MTAALCSGHACIQEHDYWLEQELSVTAYWAGHTAGNALRSSLYAHHGQVSASLGQSVSVTSYVGYALLYRINAMSLPQATLKMPVCMIHARHPPPTLH